MFLPLQSYTPSVPKGTQKQSNIIDTYTQEVNNNFISTLYAEIGRPLILPNQKNLGLLKTPIHKDLIHTINTVISQSQDPEKARNTLSTIAKKVLDDFYNKAKDSHFHHTKDFQTLWDQTNAALTELYRHIPHTHIYRAIKGTDAEQCDDFATELEQSQTTLSQVKAQYGINASTKNKEQAQWNAIKQSIHPDTINTSHAITLITDASYFMNVANTYSPSDKEKKYLSMCKKIVSWYKDALCDGHNINAHQIKLAQMLLGTRATYNSARLQEVTQWVKTQWNNIDTHLPSRKDRYTFSSSWTSSHQVTHVRHSEPYSFSLVPTQPDVLLGGHDEDEQFDEINLDRLTLKETDAFLDPKKAENIAHGIHGYLDAVTEVLSDIKTSIPSQREPLKTKLKEIHKVKKALDKSTNAYKNNPDHTLLTNPFIGPHKDIAHAKKRLKDTFKELKQALNTEENRADWDKLVQKFGASDPKKMAKNALKRQLIHQLNEGQSWNPIFSTIPAYTLPGVGGDVNVQTIDRPTNQTFNNLTPETKPQYKIKEWESRQASGRCCQDTTHTDQGTNTWLSTIEDISGQRIGSSIRHGIVATKTPDLTNTLCEINDSKELKNVNLLNKKDIQYAVDKYFSKYTSARKWEIKRGLEQKNTRALTMLCRAIGNYNKAMDIVRAALVAHLEQTDPSHNPSNVIPLNITSTSLITPDLPRTGFGFIYHEKDMLKEQYRAFREVENQHTITILDKSDHPQEYNVHVSITDFNFSVNEGAHSLKVGKSSEFLHNLQSMNKLDTRVDNYLAQKPPIDPEKKQDIEQLWSSIKVLFCTPGAKNSYELPSRIHLLTHMLKQHSASNCKSGKDRTTIARNEEDKVKVLYEKGGLTLVEKYYRFAQYTRLTKDTYGKYTPTSTTWVSRKIDPTEDERQQFITMNDHHYTHGGSAKIQQLNTYFSGTKLFGMGPKVSGKAILRNSVHRVEVLTGNPATVYQGMSDYVEA